MLLSYEIKYISLHNETSSLLGCAPNDHHGLLCICALWLPVGSVSLLTFLVIQLRRIIVKSFLQLAECFSVPRFAITTKFVDASLWTLQKATSVKRRHYCKACCCQKCEHVWAGSTMLPKILCKVDLTNGSFSGLEGGTMRCSFKDFKLFNIF